MVDGESNNNFGRMMHARRLYMLLAVFVISLGRSRGV